MRTRLPLIFSLLLSAVTATAGDSDKSRQAVRTFHIGNSLTDTVDGWLAPVAERAGTPIDFHRFTIPGAPTDWLWNHPGSGFGDSKYPEAFASLAPIDHLFTQPFAGHDRSIDNEAEYSGKFFDLCRRKSPNVQRWLYAQWPAKAFKDNWSQGKGSAAKLNLKPAATWQEGVANHLKYTLAVRDRIDADQPGKPVRIVPAGTALARLKTEIDAGRIAGMSDFFAETFSDDLHLGPKGRYLVALVHYCCIVGKAPAKADPLKTGLTAEQAERFRSIAWETVKEERWTGVGGR